MKFQILLSAALLVAAQAQNGYIVPGGTGSVALPSAPSATTTTTTKVVGSDVVVPSFPGANLFSLKQGSTDTKVTNWNIDSTLRNDQGQLGSPVKSTESLFSRIPSRTELNKFADDGDVASIQKTLQVLAADDSVDCKDKVAYLLDVLGTVKAAIQRKNLAADELQVVIDGAKAEIARLQGQIARVQKLRDDLKLPDLFKNVNDLVAKLDDFYNKIYTVKSQIPPEEARIAGYLKEIDILTKQNSDNQNRISNDNLKLVQTNNLIRDIQTRLQDAKDLRDSLTASIAANTALIKDNNTKIANIRVSIDEVNAKIRGLKDTLDGLNKAANTLEVDVQRARTDLSVAQAKDKVFADQIKDFQNQITVQQPRLRDDDLLKLRTLITNLTLTLPQIQNQINREYYYCYGAGKVQTITTGSTIVYVIRGQAFGQYINNAYGQSWGAGNLRDNDQYRLQVVDPFSAVWTSKFGLPWKVGGNGGNGGFDGFSCSGSGAGSTGLGTIASVSPTGIVVKDINGKEVSLTIGTCSRMEATTQVPQVGQNFAWRAHQSGNAWNLHSATCW